MYKPLLLFAALMPLACAGSATPFETDPDASGAMPGSGGRDNVTGGAGSSTAAPATGGRSNTTGQASSTGGKTGSGTGGGTSDDTGGSSTTGGTSNSNAGGNQSRGGTTASGGAVATGGNNTKGGSAGVGGTSNTGGTSTRGGSNTGGSIPNAGGTSTGGSPATGGNSNTGGTRATGGSSNPVVSDCGLPAAGASNVAKPSGTPGNLTVLNWAGFKGAVSYTFDDANSSQISNYSALNALGVPMTFYLQTGKSDAANAVWAQALKDGHELGNHSKSHTQTGSASDVDAASTFIQQNFGVTAYTMAAPYGDASYSSIAQTRFLINRGVSNALIAPNDNTNPFNLPCYIPPSGAAASAFNAQIDTAQSGGGWRVVLVHGFTGGSDGAYQPVSITEFTSSVEHAKSLGGLWIDSVVTVGAYWRAQKLVAASSPTTSGSNKTYSWTLPANFPPGKCLRVKIDGGILTQGGKELSWDGHGYYEVPLDAGSVTLSP